MANAFEITYALIDADGIVRPVKSQSKEWLASFARHHRLAIFGVGRGTPAVSTVFLGCGRLADGAVKGAFETALINSDGRVVRVDGADTADAALANHRLAVRQLGG